MNILVGSTGFVGSNLFESGAFDRGFHSRNVQEAYGLKPDLLVYAGLRAEKYLANHAPEKDRELILQAEENIKRIAPKKLVLISTVDVLRDPNGADETTLIRTDGLEAYGANRYLLECWVRERYADALIIRLPGLFGKNIKKNFIYDYMNVIPFMLKQDKWAQLCEKEPRLEEFYELQPNEFYRCRALLEPEKKELRACFKQIGFTALHFTDSRSRYQFYPLSRLWEDIQTAREHGIKLWHPATEPVSAAEVYRFLTGQEFVNELAGNPADYDYRTIYDGLFGGRGGYICDKQTILEEIKRFTEQEMA